MRGGGAPVTGKGRGMHVLVVDDEPMICKGLAKLLRQADERIQSVETADNGETAMRLIEERRPDIVFTDIRMPRMDGLQLCGLLFERYPDVQLVVVSGYSDFEYAKRCMSYGAKDYILKPINRKQVQETVAKLIRESDRRLSSQAYVSPRSIEEKVSRLASAWSALRAAEVQRLLEDWSRAIAEYPLGEGKRIELVSEIDAMFRGRMQLREGQPAPADIDYAACPSWTEAFGRFGGELMLSLEREAERRRDRSKHPVDLAKRYIDEHLAEEITLDEVAEVLGLNASYFSQLFKQVTGETFIHYRIRRRMEKAKRLLADPERRITDISFEVGYADHPHFTKTFKKMTGLSPTEYRISLGIRE